MSILSSLFKKTRLYNATDHFRIDCFDGGRKIYQSIPYNTPNSITAKITWQAVMGIPAATTAFDSRYVALPYFIFLKGGQVLSLLMNNPLAGNNISIMNITFKRWKI